MSQTPLTIDAALSAQAPLPVEARHLLKSVFGYDDFRPGQDQVLAHVVAGESVLAVMPTGSGKSMCYQLPALMEEGLTLVVSPLIALMRDQVSQMQSLGIAAATLNTMTQEDEAAEIWAQLRAGAMKLLYVSPERLVSESLLRSLKSIGVKRLAIDEAHCVSEWGHDFRPEYRQLRRAVAALGPVPVLALTATADRITRADIVERLFEHKPATILHSFDRPNIDLTFAAKDQPKRQLLAFLDRHRGQNGIVYCASRARTEALAEYFVKAGHEAFAYHAGMEQEQRNHHQDRFLREDGVIAVATVAFGMGINKPDVRFVAHADMPASVESYYQEIGRAGRDGLPAHALTLFGIEDMALRRRQIEDRDLTPEQRQNEHRRLDAIITLCEATSCRRQTLLAYFDEVSPECGGCDVCLGHRLSYDGTIDAQKALSAVARTGQRFGADYLADILIGRASDLAKRHQHEAIKTFGIGKERPKQAWLAIIRQLYAAGALETASREFGGFRLTLKGDDILRGRQTIELCASKASISDPRSALKERSGPSLTLDPSNEPLLAALKRLRREIARQEGIAAFMVFPDRSLIDMVEKRPVTLVEMSLVHGVGQSKLTRYGLRFLTALAEAGQSAQDWQKSA
jgi:ATP-dependent DNA helicase RecQ